MLFKSLILNKASGSVGGGTFSRNRFGQYIRQRSTPVNPSSSRQQQVRATFAALAGYWSETLTQAHRDSWNLYGNTVEMVNAIGDTIHLTGFNHFIRSNSAILQASGAQVDAGPTNMSLPTVDETAEAEASEATQLISIAFNDAMAWCSEDAAHMTVLMASPKGVGVDFIGGPFRFAGSIDGNSVTPITSPQTIAVPFAVAEDQKSQVQLRIARADGRVTAPFRDSLAVGA